MDEQRKVAMVAQIRAEAHAFLRCVFLLRQIYPHVSSEVSSLDTLLEMTHQALYVPDASKVIFEGLGAEATKERLTLKILTDRATDWLLDQASGASPQTHAAREGETT